MKERLDVLLVKRGIYQSRERAKASIMAGIVFVDGQKSDKAGNMVDTEAEIFVKENICLYVSRGGLKLEKSIREFDLNMQDKVCMDIGASTGGFTDCMLQNGAVKVYAIDVGYGQLDWKLRTDDRVVNMEKCNVRYLDTDLIAEPIDFISIDVSFISLKLIFPVAAKVLAEDGEIVCLVKPQFEAGREKVGKKGVVRDKSVHEEVVNNIISFALSNGFSVLDLEYSPIKGPEGNIEYLVHIKKTDDPIKEESVDIHSVVEAAHGELDRK